MLSGCHASIFQMKERHPINRGTEQTESIARSGPRTFPTHRQPFADPSSVEVSQEISDESRRSEFVQADSNTNHVDELESVSQAENDEMVCQELADQGQTYWQIVGRWLQEGNPVAMDADMNGIPCESAYPKDDIEAALAGQPKPSEPEQVLVDSEAVQPATTASAPSDFTARASLSATSAVITAAASPIPEEPMMTPATVMYDLTAGDLKSQVLRWCSEEGWRCLWQAPYTYSNEIGITIEGSSFIDVLRQTIALYRNAPRPLALHQHPNVLRIREHR